MNSEQSSVSFELPPSFQVDGIDVFVEGSSPDTIVMLHGWPDTWRLWDAQVQHLSSRWRCVRFTLPGFDVTLPRRALSMEQMVDFLRRVVEQASPDRPVVLMLHDWGCIFGWELAMRHPELVSRIVAVDVGDAVSAEYRRTLGARAIAMTAGYQGWLALAWGLSGLGLTRLADGMTRRMARWLHCRADPRRIGACMNYPYFIAWTGAHGSYRRLLPVAPSCPVLYCYGKKKPFMFHSERWARELAGSKGCKVLRFDTGHWVMRQAPGPFNAAVSQWLLT